MGFIMRLKRTQNNRVAEDKHSTAMVKDITRTAKRSGLIDNYFGTVSTMGKLALKTQPFIQIYHLF